MANRENRQREKAIAIFLVALAVLFILAIYGYLSGAWDEVPV